MHQRLSLLLLLTVSFGACLHGEPNEKDSFQTVQPQHNLRRSVMKSQNTVDESTEERLNVGNILQRFRGSPSAVKVLEKNPSVIKTIAKDPKLFQSLVKDPEVSKLSGVLKRNPTLLKESSVKQQIGKIAAKNIGNKSHRLRNVVRAVLGVLALLTVPVGMSIPMIIG
ncbi:hypothetical protein PHMEG_00020054 [Phytophthora megakarya]|uniref:RxLR effector protein n=1 Tax=Phytophthora megakarya TaxID=4795 RepID=A0A225VSP3_9STRA|nr:hypothetical protein PHMEG_00020054 [Phytophthora megakarya]